MRIHDSLYRRDVRTKSPQTYSVLLSILGLIAIACNDDAPVDTGNTTFGTAETVGDGDGDTATGDGDGDTATGDGDGDTGDGDGDSGDGDGDTGDGDGDGDTGDGDGDTGGIC